MQINIFKKKIQMSEILKSKWRKMWEEFITQSLFKWLGLTTCKCFINTRTLPKSRMHILNVSITTVQGLKNVSQKVWEELITQSRNRLLKICWKNDEIQLHAIFRKMSDHFQNTTCTSSMRPEVWRVSTQRCNKSLEESLNTSLTVVDYTK
jgi:hypothetical protein